MYRKAAIVVSILLLAFTTACSSKHANATSAAGGAAATATASPTVCPTQETKKFAKTLFVTDAALAGGAFKHWIYTPAKQGKFKKGAHGRITAIVKAVAAGAFVINRLNAVKKNAESDPALCKLTIGPITKFTSAVTGLVSKGKSCANPLKSCDLNDTSVNDANSDLTQFHSGSASGGDAFTDNQNAKISG